MKENKSNSETPLLKQFFEIKAQYPDAILLYRVGDFYETFGEDACKASKALGIVLTRKASGNGTFTELAGVPYHSLDNYLPKLVQSGYKVAVCDQLEDPKLTKKLVKRGVTELVTPGVAYNDNLLEAKENNYLAALSFEKKQVGAAFLDISTGTFKVAQGSLEYMEVLISNMSPREILMEKSYIDGFRQMYGNIACITPMDGWPFAYESAKRKLLSQLGTENLKGFGIENMPLAVSAAGAVLYYLELTHHSEISHIRNISRIDRGNYVWMDKFTVRNLELFHSLSGNEGTALIDVIDRCASPMGSRLLREWLAMPLKDASELNARYDIVDAFVSDSELRENLRGEIGNIGDLERIIAKAAAGRLLPREALQLGRALKSIASIKALIEGRQFEKFQKGLSACSELYGVLNSSILPEAASAIGKGDVIASGISEELDELRRVLHSGKEILLQIQQREKDRTGISSLKISYNNVFGYYLEVRNTFKDKVPEEWIRKQTLVNAERYITPELKQYEETILGAEEKILSIEARIYADIVSQIQAHISEIQQNAITVANMDILAGFADLAVDANYTRPVVDDSFNLTVTQGRHPVIEAMMKEGETYIANDLSLDNQSQRIIILTGPNMAGKSALLRQTALICLLAQIGCFVPAEKAEIGLVDKIFTRVGASDNISRGESTFMVEMLETASILNNISSRSLVLLDEIGRGTSTFDGMSIAWSIVEYLAKNGGPKTLFATHYHELNELETIYGQIQNYHISVKEVDGKVVFLRKLCKGGVAHSFGIHVARMAGMPDEVVARAELKLRALEGDEAAYVSAASSDLAGRMNIGGKNEGKGIQLSLYQLDDPLLLDLKQELQRMDINKMSPLDAFDAIRGLKKKIGL